MFKFPPFLTEQWASAYFQILFSVLVFAIGIPFLGLQLVLQEDVRHVVTYRQWKLLLWLGLVFLLFLSAVSFIWFLHPGPAGQKPDAGILRAEKGGGGPASPAVNDPASAQQPTIQQADAPPGPPAANAPDTEDYIQALVAGMIVTVVPIVTLIFGYWLPTNYTRRKVIRQFRDDLVRGFNKKRTLNKKILSNLVYLGEHGNPGNEKNLVIDSFAHIARHVQKDTPAYKYKGRELAEMIKGVGYILEHREKPGNDDNYRRCAALLKNVWTNVSGEITYHDATLATSMLKQLGATAVKEKAAETAHTYIKYAAECDDSVVFELALKAIEVKNFRIATDALNKLEGMAIKEQQGKLESSDTTSNLLGLLAHYDDAGASAKRRAALFLTRAQASFSPSLESCIKSAVNYHYLAGDFDTADKLLLLLGEMAKHQAQQV
jgi:hypothetical protein